jgi:SAM-dependent methyltransferase
MEIHHDRPTRLQRRLKRRAIEYLPIRCRGSGYKAADDSQDHQQAHSPVEVPQHIVCLIAFGTLPDRESAAREFSRVLRPDGGVGLSDLTRDRSLPEDLDGLLAWVACNADAQSVEGYAGHLRGAGLRVDCIEEHDEALSEMVGQVRLRLLGAEIAVGLKLSRRATRVGIRGDARADSWPELTISRQAYGFRNFENCRQRVQVLCG